jgi:hypothetical protein
VLESELVENIEEVHVVGDAREPRKIIDAIHDGFTAGVGI